MRTIFIKFIDKTRNVFSKYKPDYELRWIRKIHDFVMGLLLPKFVVQHGFKIFIDKEDSVGISRGRSYDDLEVRILDQYIREGDKVLDAGANIGYHTLHFARKVGNDGLVIAVEPFPETGAILAKNIIENGFSHNVRVIIAACSSKQDFMPLQISSEEGNPLNPASLKIGTRGKDKFYVHTLTVDQLCATFDFAKIDVEGQEYQVLLGMGNVFKNSPNLKILLEFYPNLLDEVGDNAKEMLKFLEKNGFKFIDIRFNESEFCSITELLARYTVENHGMTNLLCVRR